MQFFREYFVHVRQKIRELLEESGFLYFRDISQKFSLPSDVVQSLVSAIHNDIVTDEQDHSLFFHAKFLENVRETLFSECEDLDR